MDSRKDFLDAQTKAERVAQAFGDAEGAPSFMNGESRRDYRIRLLSKYISHSKSYKNVDLNNVKDETAFTAIEDGIYADGMRAAHDPSTRPGQMWPVRTRDASGREMTKYEGDIRAFMDQFNPPIRHVTRFMTSGRA